MYRILLVFEISNNKISILSRFQAFIDLHIPYLEFSCLNVSHENEAEVEKEIIKGLYNTEYGTTDYYCLILYPRYGF